MSKQTGYNFHQSSNPPTINSKIRSTVRVRIEGNIKNRNCYCIQIDYDDDNEKVEEEEEEEKKDGEEEKVQGT